MEIVIIIILIFLLIYKQIKTKPESPNEEIKTTQSKENITLLNTPPETVPLDRTNGALRPLKWCMVTAVMVH